ncbi:hypothetical protein BGW38_003954, partial [Lunasporangiospora selenospora]
DNDDDLQDDGGQWASEFVDKQLAGLTLKASTVAFANKSQSSDGGQIKTVLSPTAAIGQASKSMLLQQEVIDEEQEMEDSHSPVHDTPSGTFDTEDTAVPTAAKKKKKKKKKSERGYPAADNDDFEEVPIEALFAAGGIYDPFRSAMECFRKERVFNPLTARLLSSYFSHGGMDDTVQGRDDIALDIDISYVHETFLSSYMFGRSGWYDPIDFVLAPKLVASFIKYLLARRVIPEYEKELQASLALAFEVKRQAPKCRRFNGLMPDWVSRSLSALLLEDYDHVELSETDLGQSHATIAVQESPPSSISNAADTTKSHSVSRVRLTEYIPGDSSNDLADHKDAWSDWDIYFASEVAAQLEPGVILYGNFFKTIVKCTSSGEEGSNESKEPEQGQEQEVTVVFAQPCMAYPSCYREEDTYESDD